jgi:hypothetical protein
MVKPMPMVVLIGISPRNNEMIEIAIEDSFQNKIYQDLYLLANLDNFKTLG